MKVIFVIGVRDSLTELVDLRMYKMGQLLDYQVLPVLQQGWELVKELRLPEPMLSYEELKKDGDVPVTCETYYAPVYGGVVVRQEGMYVHLHDLPFASSSEKVAVSLAETGWSELTEEVRGLIQ